ncbi:restriction endonuclease subunit S [Aliivibrio fischeri]|uniref:restriction endonuclease subunit S n=1 Tax=Aliivibrio fischeri TaxID=668 RepID=UPI0012DA5001|nr:restriction endonuclease subunit S [Aliivibrio fischeri]MUK64386.1 hypothetical protein [Aliivibrio fischeri]
MNQGWVRKKLKDCFKLKSGDGLTAKNMIAGDYPVFGGNSQAGTHNTFNLSGDNVIVGRVGALCGNARHITEDIWLTDNAFKIIDKKYDFDNKFLTYLLNFKNLRSLARQAAQPVISNSSLKDLELEFPLDVEEQKRIVSLLDTVFADLEQTRAKTEQNLKNARELFDSYLQQVFSQKGEGWVESALGELSQINYGYTEKASFDANGPHFLRITDIQDGEVDWSTVPFCPISEADHNKHKLISGDIVFARTGATTGKSYLLTSPPDSVAASYLIRLRLTSDSLLPEFVKFFFQTKEYWDVVNAGMSGSAQGGFNASKLSAMKIKYPQCQDAQNKFIEQLIEVSSHVDQVKDVYMNKLVAIDELKKSILQKAFSGELTHE